MRKVPDTDPENDTDPNPQHSFGGIVTIYELFDTFLVTNKTRSS
jgi:hypothetical protein